MKINRRHKGEGEGGVATILIVGVILVFLIFFLVLAIDFAYIYVVRGQVQNAADAASIAGADLIVNKDDTVQFAARQEAIKFAAKNFAGGDPVIIVTDNSNVLSDSNDITVGFWNGSTYTRGVTPVNALEARPRRTGNSPGGPVGLFFGSIVGWDIMDVERIAVATHPPAPTTGINVCIRSCDIPAEELPAFFVFKENKPTVPDEEKTVSFSNMSCADAQDLGPNSTIAKLIRGDIPLPNVCDTCINTNNGTGAVLGILIDEYNENKDENGNWTIVAPVVKAPDFCPNCKSGTKLSDKDCPTGDQTAEPYYVVQYATLIINSVQGQPNPGLTVTHIQCTECPAIDLFGGHAKLVR